MINKNKNKNKNKKKRKKERKKESTNEEQERQSTILSWRNPIRIRSKVPDSLQNCRFFSTAKFGEFRLHLVCFCGVFVCVVVWKKIDFGDG